MRIGNRWVTKGKTEPEKVCRYKEYAPALFFIWIVVVIIALLILR